MALHHHLALFYEKPAPLWAQCAALIQQHVAEGWAWRYVADERTAAVASAALAERLVEGDSQAVVASAALHLQDSPVRVSSVAAALRQLIRRALQTRPAPGLLLLVEMTWAIRTPSGAVYLREYEAAVHDLLQEQPAALVCLYNRQVMLDRQLLIGLHTHPLVCAPDGLHANPHFIPPRIFEQRDERAQFRHWLGAISPALLGEPAAPSAQAVLPAESVYAVEPPALLVAETNRAQGRWKIQCFGPLHLYLGDGALVDWRARKGAPRKTKTLFAYLLYRGEQGAAAEQLAELLWPEERDLKRSLNRLYHAVNCLREILSPGLETKRASPFVIRQAQHYYLAAPQNTWVDYPMFQELCYRAATLQQHGDHEQALLCFQSAERLYTGDFLADIPLEYAANRDEDWCWSRRYWFRDMYLKVLYSLAGICRQTRRVADALTYADKALRVDPCSEMANQEKLLALHAARRRDALDRQYRLYCLALEHFDVGQPSPTVHALYRSLRADL